MGKQGFRGDEILKVNEIFYSIQGESSLAGFPCVFIRLTGCNLRCSYCDTQYAYDEGEDLQEEAILSQVGRYRCSLVEVTGGEPLMQSETPQLIRRLLDGGYRVLLETNGSIDISIVDERCIRIVDMKLPGSGEAHRNNLHNLRILHKGDELKFVIGGRDDYIFAREIISLAPKDAAKGIVINFSPLWGKMDPRILAEWILVDRIDVRLNIQLHKVIWPGDMRGV